jgi:hypothetical protein
VRDSVDNTQVLPIPDQKLLPPIVERLVPTSGSFVLGKSTQDGPAYAPEYWHRYQQMRRWRLLHGSGELEDPLQQEPPARFHIAADDFLRLAKRTPPTTVEATVTSFTAWIYSLYTAAPQKSTLELGWEAEYDIQVARATRSAQVNSMSEVLVSDWELVHNGMAQRTMPPWSRGKENSHYYEIPGLLVRSRPLRASPDLLYRHRQTHDSVLVEVKFSDKPIPLNLWPNVWAQLWAYAQISEIQDSPTIRAVGEVWGAGTNLDVCLRRVVARDPRAVAFDSFFLELFDVFRSAALA